VWKFVPGHFQLQNVGMWLYSENEDEEQKRGRAEEG
jgi:hypothetical protein